MKNVTTPTPAPMMEDLELYSVHDVRTTAKQFSGLMQRGAALGDIAQCHAERDLCVKILRMEAQGFFPFCTRQDKELIDYAIRACEDRMQGLTQLAGPEEDTLDMTEEINARVNAGLWGGGQL